MICYINNPKSDMCPNRFYMAIGEVEIGEIQTLQEYNKHPLRFNDKEHQVDASFVKEKPWNLTPAAFNELRKNGVHFIVVHTSGDSEQVFLSGCQVITDKNFIAQAVKLIFCCEEFYTYAHYLEIIEKYILEVEQNKDKIDLSENIDIQKEAYNISSELFHFKDLRRGVVEHGRICFIEGYKKHAELFYNFLQKNGYFSSEELTNVLAEFDHYLTGKPCVTISTAEQVLGKLYPWLPQDSCLTMVQKDIVELYRSLDDAKDTLLIQKPRQKGVTTICKIIAYIEAKNGKNVLYLGYGPNDKMLKDMKNVTYLDANNEASVKRCIGKKFDLIIVDEMITFTIPIKTEHDLRTTLTENGKMIIVGTPLEPEWRNYNAMKDFFTSYHTTGEIIGQKIVYTIHPDRQDYERAEHYPECKNEMLGQWND